MEGNEEYKLLAFNSTHHALEAEDILKKEGYKIIMLPIPPEITADCGIAIRLNDSFKEILILLAKKNIEVAGYYRILKEGLEKKITRLNLV